MNLNQGVRKVTMHPDVCREHRSHSKRLCGEEPCSAMCVIARLRHGNTNRAAYRRNAHEEVAAYGAIDTVEPKRKMSQKEIVKKALAIGGLSDSLRQVCEDFVNS